MSDSDDDVQYWGDYPSTRRRDATNQPNPVPGSLILSRRAARSATNQPTAPASNPVSGYPEVSSGPSASVNVLPSMHTNQQVPPFPILMRGASVLSRCGGPSSAYLTHQMSDPSVLPTASTRVVNPTVKTVPKPASSQPMNHGVANSLSPSSGASAAFVCRSAFCAGCNHVGCSQATQNTRVRAASSSSFNVPRASIGAPVPTFPQHKETEAQLSFPAALDGANNRNHVQDDRTTLSTVATRAINPTVLKSVPTPELSQPVNAGVGNALSSSSTAPNAFGVQSAYRTGSNHSVQQGIANTRVRDASSSSSNVPRASIGAPVTSVTGQKDTQTRLAHPSAVGRANNEAVFQSGVKHPEGVLTRPDQPSSSLPLQKKEDSQSLRSASGSQTVLTTRQPIQPVLTNKADGSSSSSTQGLPSTASISAAYLLPAHPQRKDQEAAKLVDHDSSSSLPQQKKADARSELPSGSGTLADLTSSQPISIQMMPTDADDSSSSLISPTEAARQLANALRQADGDIRPESAQRVVLSSDYTTIWTEFVRFAGDREKARLICFGSPTRPPFVDNIPTDSEADLKMAALANTFNQEQHDLFNDWMNARLQEEKPATATDCLSLVPHSAFGQPPREPRKADDPQKHIKWWTGRNPEPICPTCGEYVGGSQVVRTTHYLKWHYDIYYSDSSEVDDELWLCVRLGSKRRPGLGDLRACLICDLGALQDGRAGLLSHIKKVHPAEYNDLQKEYKEKFSRKEVEDEDVKQILMEEENVINPVSEKPSKRRKMDSINTGSRMESDMAKAVRMKLQLQYADYGMNFEEGAWLTDKDEKKFREWMDFWESPEGKKMGGPPKTNVHLEVISPKCEQRVTKRASNRDAPNAKESPIARAVREKLTRCYSDYGMALPDGVWFRDEDAAKFEEWMNYWESDEGKAAGGPPKQGNQ